MSSGWAIEAANSIESKQRMRAPIVLCSVTLLSNGRSSCCRILLPLLSHDEDEWSLSQVCPSIFCEVLVGL
jgi:hypothetical protein